MKHKKENPIALKSQQWLLDALMKLMHEKPYHKVTITEICREADLDRSTFYRNFDTKESLLNQYIQQLTEEFIRRLREAERLTMDQISNVFFNLCIDELDFFVNLRNNGLSNFVLESFNNQLPHIHTVVTNKLEYLVEDEYLMYALAFNAGGMWNMLMSWIDNGMKEPYTDLINAFKEISNFNSYN